MQTPLTQLLGIGAPIIQAPMAGVSTPALASAVSNAGALGSIAVGAMTPEAAERTIKETAAETGQPFNVNLFAHKAAAHDTANEANWLDTLRPIFDELGAETPQKLATPYPSFNDNTDMLDILLAQKPAVVSFHFGLPVEIHLKALKATGAILMASATTVGEAEAIEAAGFHAVVAQGYEAGGHRGIFGEHDTAIKTQPLIGEITARTKLPVVAAGGIMTGVDIARSIEAGAAGAQLGTAFVCCPETSAGEAYKEALLSGSVETTVTSAISGRPARGIINRFMALDEKAVPDYPIAYDAGKKLFAAAQTANRTDFSVMWAGTGANHCRAMPAAELLKTLLAEMVTS